MRIEAANGAHWYLAGLGVEPAQQRQGIGSALLQPGIEGSTREGLPCVLLTNDEKNLSFYEHHGFETVLEGEKPPGGPYAWAMVRKPR
jgi:ribosomal protein S18 acetylase RimI-like enzyme